LSLQSSGVHGDPDAQSARTHILKILQDLFGDQPKQWTASMQARKDAQKVLGQCPSATAVHSTLPRQLL